MMNTAGAGISLAATPTFEETPLRVIMMEDRPVFLAREVGRMLGYEKDGSNLLRQMRREWSEEVEEGFDFVSLDGEQLAQLKDVLKKEGGYYPPSFEDDEEKEGGDHTTPLKGAKSVTLLTESGFNLVAILSRKPLGRSLRRWLAREVLPALRQTGTYSMPGAGAAAQVEGAGGPLLGEIARHLKLADELSAMDMDYMARDLRRRAALLICPELLDVPPAPPEKRRKRRGKEKVTYELGYTSVVGAPFSPEREPELYAWLTSLAQYTLPTAPERCFEWQERLEQAGLPWPWPEGKGPADAHGRATLVGKKLLRLVGAVVEVGGESYQLVCSRNGRRPNTYWFEPADKPRGARR